MDYKLKAEIKNAIDKVIENHALEDVAPLWEGWIQSNLTEKMTDAAALIFDSSMDGQKYKEQND